MPILAQVWSWVFCFVVVDPCPPSLPPILTCWRNARALAQQSYPVTCVFAIQVLQLRSPWPPIGEKTFCRAASAAEFGRAAGVRAVRAVPPKLATRTSSTLRSALGATRTSWCALSVQLMASCGQKATQQPQRRASSLSRRPVCVSSPSDLDPQIVELAQGRPPRLKDAVMLGWSGLLAVQWSRSTRPCMAVGVPANRLPSRPSGPSSRGDRTRRRKRQHRPSFRTGPVRWSCILPILTYKQMITTGSLPSPPVLSQVAESDPHSTEKANKERKVDALFHILPEDVLNMQERAFSHQARPGPAEIRWGLGLLASWCDPYNQVSADWKRRYGVILDPHLDPSDALRSRVYKEFYKQTMTVIEARRVRSMIHVSIPKTTENIKLSDSIQLQFQEETSVAISNIVEYYWALRVLTKAWSWGGLFEANDHDETRKLFISLTDAQQYADFALRNTVEFGQGSVAWLQRNDLLTRSKMASLIRRGYTAGSALIEAAKQCHLEWHAPGFNGDACFGFHAVVGACTRICSHQRIGTGLPPLGKEYRNSTTRARSQSRLQSRGSMVSHRSSTHLKFWGLVERAPCIRSPGSFTIQMIGPIKFWQKPPALSRTSVLRGAQLGLEARPLETTSAGRACSAPWYAPRQLWVE